jgi:hypothetical protein
MRIVAIVLLTLGALVSGCDGGASSPMPIQFIQPVECVGIPARTCQEIVTEARRNAQPGTFPVQIRAVCTQVPCTAEQGMVDIDIQYSDGRRERSGMGWAGAVDVGDPAPAPPSVALPGPTCQGVPLERCTEVALGGDPTSGAVISVVVRCTAEPCTAERGAGDTILTFADGTTSTSNWSYEDAAPSG